MASMFLLSIVFLAFGFFKVQQQIQQTSNNLELLHQAQSLVEENLFAEAVKFCEKIPPGLYDKKPDAKAGFEHTYGLALYHLGQTEFQPVLLQKAIPLLTNAAQTWERLNWKAKKAAALNDLGRTYYLLALFEPKSASLEQAFSFLREASHLPGVKKTPSLCANIHLSLAMVLYSLYHSQNQINFLNNALEFLESARHYYDSHPSTETSLTNLYLSLCYLELSKTKNDVASLKKAFGYAIEARHHLQPRLNPLFTRLLWFTLGEIYLIQSRHEKPRLHLVLAYRAFLKAKVPNLPPVLANYQSRFCMAMSHIYQYFGHNDGKQKRLLQALSWTQKALTAVTPESQPQLFVSCYLAQGSLYARLAELTEPWENLTRALQVYSEMLAFTTLKLSSETATTIHSKVGLLSFELAKLEKPETHLAQAIESLTSALRICRFGSDSEREKVEYCLDDASHQLEKLRLTAENANRMLEAFQRLLRLYEPTDFPDEFAHHHAKLGRLYQQAATFDNSLANYHQSIAHLEAAEAIYRTLHTSKKQAATLADLAKTHLELSYLENSETNLENALRIYNQAHQITSVAKLSKEQSLLQIGIGTAHRLLAKTQNRMPNLTKSLRALEFAFNTLDAKEHPQDFLAVLVELALTHNQTAEYSEPKYHLLKAVQYFKRALDMPLPDTLKNSFKIKNEYAQTLMKLADYHQAGQNLDQAIALFSSLQEHYRLHEPTDEMVLLLNHLALSYQKLSEVSLDQKRECLSQAIRILDNCLTLIDPERYPLDYAMTQNNQGIAYSRLAKITDRETNSKKARLALEQALRIYTPENYPEEYQKVRENLGNITEIRR